jgi:phytoene synthase
MWGLGIARRKQPSSGSSFHYSFGLLPRPQRQGIEALYAFCRRVDDVADEGSGDQASAVADLQHYREEIDRCYNGTPSVPVTRELQRTIRRYRIPRSPLDAILEGVEMDLTKARYANFRELRGYCYRVASAVGIVCTSIFECQHPASHDYAVDLGIALQLTNILRDLRADALRGRIYVPLDEIQAFGYSEGEMLSGDRNEAFLALMRYQVDRADRHFDTAGSLLPDSDRKKLLAAEVMGAIYRRLLRRIEADGFRVFEHRIRVPRLTQLSLALRAWVTGRVGG